MGFRYVLYYEGVWLDQETNSSDDKSNNESVLYYVGGWSDQRENSTDDKSNKEAAGQINFLSWEFRSKTGQPNSFPYES